MLTYLRVEPIPGRWYLSEGWRFGRKSPGDSIPDSHVAHNRPPAEMIVAGPFETRDEALAFRLERPEFHSTDDWQAR